MSAQRSDAPDYNSEEALLPPVRHLTEAEARELFDQNARHYLGISGVEFVQRWDAGEFRGNDSWPNHTAVMAVAMLLPLVGRE